MSPEPRTARQLAVPGWDQARIADLVVAVVGGDWAGRFTAIGLALMGVGTVSFVGTPAPGTEMLGSELIGPDGPVLPYTHEPVSLEELAWGIGPADVIVACSPEPGMQRACRAIAGQLAVPYICAGGSGHPVPSLGAAGLAVDAVRDLACPFTGRPPEGSSGEDVPNGPAAPGPLALLGAGGIGTWAAVAAVAAGLQELIVIDEDHVEASNLNRQILYTPDDARAGRPKAEAAAEALTRLGMGTRITALVAHVDDRLAGSLASLRPALLVSALDNAAARLTAQGAASALGIPLVHAGTDVFAADVYTQLPGGPSIDDQMHGGLVEAAAREAGGGGGPGCTGVYVVPGMVAGALAAQRVFDVAGGRPIAPLPPLHWRAGALPTAGRLPPSA